MSTACRKLSQRRIRIFDAGNNRDTVNLTTGDRFLIRLYENRESGLIWQVQVTSDISIIKDWGPSVASNYRCMHVWCLKVLKPGTHRFIATCERLLDTGYQKFSYCLDINAS